MPFLDQDFKLLCGALRGRLDDASLDDVLDYLDHNEAGLALETLCDQLYEHAVPIRANEYAAIHQLRETLDLDAARIAFLSELLGKSELG